MKGAAFYILGFALGITASSTSASSSSSSASSSSSSSSSHSSSSISQSQPSQSFPLILAAVLSQQVAHLAPPDLVEQQDDGDEGVLPALLPMGSLAPNPHQQTASTEAEVDSDEESLSGEDNGSGEGAEAEEGNVGSADSEEVPEDPPNLERGKGYVLWE